ncbi:adenylate/guanylate cyclase domain-containing protein [Oscillatoria sp. FACHB-1406]|uniref:adenylate/guanylate cyclase domain-containing protein n=1 Tax=Oscillatoria sp. FACHB-1406 TaxID=2692846 RepID=UPI001689C5D4|nr:adenylate/guanylate cyclase domain-containing protein [Oscillatoria sp. FACHB-1406]MBD2577734.1 response regulator [Oscillatoria sp. FACHB-1406]
MLASKFVHYRPRILVIDDTPANLKLLTQMLSQQGYDVRVAPSGAIGLNAAFAEPPDLILLDIQMPQMDGYEVCQRLKEDRRTQDIPMLFLSALDATSDKVKAFRVGGADYVTKPFELVEVLARVENQLKLRWLQLALRRSEQESRVLFEASKALNEAPDLHCAIISILESLCRLVYWEYAEVWMPNSASTHLHLVASYDSSEGKRLEAFQQQRQSLSLAPGEGLPGRIWENQQSEWIKGDEDGEITRGTGLRVGYGVPALVNNEPIAVFAFYLSSDSFDPKRAIGIVNTVMAQLTAFLGRKQAEEALQRQQAKTEELLLNILPQPIAERLQNGETTIADSFENASVLFADIVGFTEFAAQRPPRKIVAVLNEIFSEFDALTHAYGLEKIKTLGDNYMVVGGLPLPHPDSLNAIAQIALDLLTCLDNYNFKNSQNFQLRIGINTGPVVAGTIGTSKPIYDLWGDTVNVASRMESTGEPGQIQVTKAVRDMLSEQFHFEERGEIFVKGKGNLLTYWLVDKK